MKTQVKYANQKHSQGHKQVRWRAYNNKMRHWFIASALLQEFHISDFYEILKVTSYSYPTKLNLVFFCNNKPLKIGDEFSGTIDNIIFLHYKSI